MSGRLPSLPRREALPLLLLLLALSSAFAFGHDRGPFHQRSLHDDISAQSLALAVNLSPEHHFTGFLRQRLDKRGEPRYVVYNRFPIGSYALTRLAILPFGDDLPQQILAARTLMLACFAAAAVLAHLALRRLLGRPWIALAATLLAFSSYYCLHYNDMISAEGSTNLLGVMLAFHGMAVFAQEGRFRQLLVKTAAAILLGWHVLGLIAPFVLLGLAGELVRARPDGAGVRWYAGAQAAAVLARSRYLACGGFAALCCAVALGWNFGAEYLALGGETPLTDLPSLRSLLRRTGSDAVLTDSYAIGWPSFLKSQFIAVGAATLPYDALQRLGRDVLQPDYPSWPPPSGFAGAAAAAGGAAAFGACLAGLRALPHRLPFAALLLAGWCWAIPFRASVALHEFEGMFHVGAPLVLCSLALPGLRRLIGRRQAARALPALAVAAAAAFALSAQQAGRVGHDAAAAELGREAAADIHAIRGVAAGRSVIDAGLYGVLGTGHAVRNYYLAGSYIQLDAYGSEEEWARASRLDFLVSPVDFGGSLTPENRRLFVYPLSALPEIYAAIAAREPAIRSTFDLRLDGRALTWTRDRCAAEDVRPPFFLVVVPLDANDLPEERRAAGFETLDFDFRERGLRFGGSCLLRSGLPDYPIAGVRAGQRGGPAGAVWEASLPVADPRFPLRADGWEDRFGALAAREPALRAPFDVHPAGRTLHYLRGECSAADPAPRFFLHVVPIDADDLPGERRAAGFDNLDFDFADRGLRYGGRCLASVGLPDYGVARVRTGQHADGVRLWEGEFAFPDAE